MDCQDVARILELPGQSRISSDKIVIKTGQLYPQPKELYHGNREYKRHLKLSMKIDHASKFRLSNQHLLEKRSTQMLYRIREGNGRAIYLVGVEDNGRTDMGLTRVEFEESLRTMFKILIQQCINLDKLIIYTWLTGESQRYIFICRVSKHLEEISITCPFI